LPYPRVVAQRRVTVTIQTRRITKHFAARHGEIYPVYVAFRFRVACDSIARPVHWDRLI
jgi:hypothetical protein